MKLVTKFVCKFFKTDDIIRYVMDFDSELNSEELDSDDIEMLQDMIMLAVNDASKKIDDTLEKKMGKFGNIPGLF